MKPYATVNGDRIELETGLNRIGNIVVCIPNSWPKYIYLRVIGNIHCWVAILKGKFRDIFHKEATIDQRIEWNNRLREAELDGDKEEYYRMKEIIKRNR